MNRDQILKLIKQLSKSQGFYGRLLRQIQDNPEILDYLAKKKFKDDLELITFLES